jgi:hypothetical protein
VFVRASVPCVIYRFLLVCALLFAVIGRPVQVHAQADAAASAQLKAQADALMDASDYPAALAKYKEAYAKLADPALLYNQGRALELMGRFPEALELLRRFDAQASPELHAKVPNLPQLIATIEEQTCDLSVSITARDQAGQVPTLKNLTIKLGDEVIGSTATMQRRVNARADATLEVTADGYEPYRATIDLPKKGTVSQPVELLPTDKTATLRVESIPGAVVTVDGEVVGQVPTEVRLAPGEHTVLVSAQGYEDNEVKFQLRRGDVRTEYIEPGSAPVYKQWWFWTIGGTLLAGGGAAGIAYAYTQERSPDKGTIAPCTTPASAGPQVDEACGEPARARRLANRLDPAGSRPFQVGPFPIFRLEF